VVGALAAGGAAICAGDVLLVAISWKSRTVLGGVAGLAGIALVGFAIASGPSGGAAEAALVIALILLVVGWALYGLGRAFERLLDADAEKSDVSECRSRR
jgi:hypothetical protein